MTLTRPHRDVERTPAPTTERRVGYVVAIGVNAAMLYVANHLLAWEWPPFLTSDFDLLLPIVNVSIVASIVVNVAYLLFDARWFKHLTQAVIAAIGVVVLVRTWQVFPFDFTPYDFDWELLTRAFLVIALVGTSIGLIAEAAKGFARLGDRR